MALRQRQWAREWRLKLRRLLGMKCKKCNSKDYLKLEFDVIIPIGDFDKTGKERHHRAMEWSWRISFYRKQYAMGNLQLLCGRCNHDKSNKLEDNQPF